MYDCINHCFFTHGDVKTNLYLDLYFEQYTYKKLFNKTRKIIFFKRKRKAQNLAKFLKEIHHPYLKVINLKKAQNI